MKWLKAATNTHSDAASSSQLAVAHPTARQSRGRSSISTAKRPARRSARDVKRSASKKRMCPETVRMIRLARSCPRVRR